MNLLNSRYHWLLSLFLFSAISVLYFGLSVILHLNTRFVGDGADPTIYIWSFGWFPHALLTHQSIFFSNVIFHPTGLNLTKVTTITGLSFLFFPVTLFFGPVVSYNLCAIFSPAIAAWTSYLLCKTIVKSNWCAFAGGYFFGFSSYMIAQSLGHLNLIAPAILLPLFVLTVLYRLDEKINTLRFITLFTLLLVFLFSIEIEIFATFVVWGSVSYTIACCFFKEKRKALLALIQPIAIASLITLIILSFFLYHFFSAKQISSAFPSAPIDFSNQLLGFIFPIRIFLINSAFPTTDLSEFNGYIGLGVLLIFIFYTLQQWYKVEAKYLIILTIVLAIASLGPALHVIKSVLFVFPWSALFTKIPLLSAALPCRIGLYTSLSLAIIIALWLKHCVWDIKYRFIMIFLAALFLIPSFSQKQRPMLQTIYTPSFFSTGIYRNYLSANDNVIILPYMFGPAMLWQAHTNFNFNMAGGFLGAPPMNYANDNVFNALFKTTPKNVTSKELEKFIDKHHVTKIIILNTMDYLQWASSARYPMRVDMNDYSAWGPLIRSLSEPPVNIGGITLYAINPMGHHNI